MELVAEDDRDLVAGHIRSGFEKPYEHKALHKDGSVIFVEVQGRKAQFHGRPVRVTAIHDISERKRAEEDVVISAATAAVIKSVHDQVVEALDGALLALDAQDTKVAAGVRQMKARFSALVENVASHQIDRLRADERKRLHTYTREIELTETLDDIFKIIRRIARTELSLFDPNIPKEPQT